MCFVGAPCSKFVDVSQHEIPDAPLWWYASGNHFTAVRRICSGICSQTIPKQHGSGMGAWWACLGWNSCVNSVTCLSSPPTDNSFDKRTNNAQSFYLRHGLLQFSRTSLSRYEGRIQDAFTGLKLRNNDQVHFWQGIPQLHLMRLPKGSCCNQQRFHSVRTCQALRENVSHMAMTESGTAFCYICICSPQVKGRGLSNTRSCQYKLWLFFQDL